jgi:uncharacterized membrane protein YhaH (DUF805 family)
VNDAGWYFAEAGQQVGPVSKQEVIDNLRGGRITPDTRVWHSSLTNWVPLSQSELGRYTTAPGHTPGQSLPPVYGHEPRGGGAYAAGGRSVSFGEAVSLFWSKYFVFSGRARRSEYWFAVLFLTLMAMATAAVDVLVLGQGPEDVFVVNTLFQLAAFIPSLAVAVRRLHDTDRSAWWILIVLVPLVGMIALIVFFCQKGTDGPNRYGV